MLTQEQIQQMKEELDSCKAPLYFFDDDPDGLCSFLLLYRYKKEGNGVIVKALPKLDDKFLRKVEEYDPDKIFILDIAMVEDSFLDKVSVPVVWIDHHGPTLREKVKIFNPRLNDRHANIPTTRMCYELNKDDLWIAAVGCIADWYMPDFFAKFKESYPDLVNNADSPEEVMFTSELGKLTKIFSFILKGKTSDVNKCFRTLTRIKTPYEILKQETPRGKFIYKTFEKIEKEYRALLNSALKAKRKDGVLCFIYQEDKMSFTGDLANELLYLFPDALIIVGREKGDELRMSLRNRDGLLNKMIENALVGLEGYGGGHEHACGANIKKKDLEVFLARLKEQR